MRVCAISCERDEVVEKGDNGACTYRGGESGEGSEVIFDHGCGHQAQLAGSDALRLYGAGADPVCKGEE
jgi:hypothetical protein